MIEDFKDKNILVLGLGRFGGGVGVASFLASQGAQVRVGDTLTEAQLKDSIEKLKDYKIDYRLGGHKLEDLDGIDLVVVNSAIPPSNDFLKEIENRGIEQTTEVNIFFEHCPGKIIAVIGTNGKETVVRFIAAILEKANREYMVGGNIGTSLLSELDQINSQTFVVFEISSFQLHRLKWIKRRPEIAVYTNIQEDHLDWHQNMENYIQDKLSALAGQGPEGVAIINVDDDNLNKNLDKVEGRLIKTSLNELTAGVFARDNQILAGTDGNYQVLFSGELKVPGRHNLANAISAAAVGYALGLTQKEIEPALLSYTGINHALEYVGEVNGVKFYNDSEATNPRATLAGLESFKENIWLIAGGFDKKIDYSPLANSIAHKVVGLAVIGQLTESLADQVKLLNPQVQINKSYVLNTAFAWIVKKAVPGDVILFSPGTSSYDQFNNLEERGDIFKSLVKKEAHVA